MLGVGCPIRRFADQRLFAPPRNFSQLITSFIVSESQGIHRTPLLTFFYNYTYRLIFTYFYLFFPICQRTLKQFQVPGFKFQVKTILLPFNVDIAGFEPSLCACRISLFKVSSSGFQVPSFTSILICVTIFFFNNLFERLLFCLFVLFFLFSVL